MSSDNNKPIVKKAQALLKEYGHEVKTGHLYEIFSKLSGENNWNIAHAKNTSFLEKVVKQFKTSSAEDKTLSEIAKEKYLYRWENNSNFLGDFNLGVQLEREGYPILSKLMDKEPNALFVGAMGSGKSVALASTVMSFFKENPENSLIFIVDPLKGAFELSPLFEFEKVYPVLNSAQGVNRVIDLLYDEAMARQEEFKIIGAENVFEWEKKTRQKKDRCLLVLEEFQVIPNLLKFKEEYKIPNTAAYKLHQILRIGRALGVWVFAATQKSTRSDIPSELLPNLTNKSVFRTSAAEAAYLLSDVKAASITSDQKGRCETDYGTVQFPFFTLKEWYVLLKNTPHERQMYCSYLTPDFIKDYLLSKSLSLESLMKNLPKEPVRALQILHERSGDKIIAHGENDSIIDLLVEHKKQGLVAIMFRKELQAKHLLKLAEGMQRHNCSRGVLYCLNSNVSAEAYKMAFDRGIDIVDEEDLLQLAKKIDHKFYRTKN